MIPLLLAQFRRSETGRWVLYGFLASASVLLLASWALALGLMTWQTSHRPSNGVVVHDVIAQSTIFLICSFALIWPIRELSLSGHWRKAIGIASLGALFLSNLVCVAISRGDLVVIPVLVVLLGWRWFGFRGAISACVAAGIFAAAAWLWSPYLRARVQQAIGDVQIYRTAHVHSDVGDHIEFIKKSIAFVRQAPVIGHGTGSISDLFRRSTIGQTGAAAVPSVNPNNQILAVAIQLGFVGATASGNVDGALLIVPRNKFNGLDWYRRGRGERGLFPFKFAFVRFCAWLALCSRCWLGGMTRGNGHCGGIV